MAEFRQTSLADCFVIQWRVVRALFLRELITRFGRDNLGVLWLVGEPMIFTLGVATLWSLAGLAHGKTLPRGARVATTQNGTLEEILVGPARENDGTFNLFVGLRTSMATCGHKDLAEFNRAEVVVAPSLQTEGKALQRDQGVGMGATNGKATALVND